MISLIQSETVGKRQWLGADELLNIVAIAESTPGPIAINTATYIGYKRAGVLGSVFATLGVVLPSFIIIFAISFFIDEFLKIELVGKAFRGIQAAVAVLIVRAGFKMSKGFKRDVMSFALLLLAIAVMITINFVEFDFSSIYLIIFSGLVGLIVGLIKNKGNKSKVAAVTPSGNFSERTDEYPTSDGSETADESSLDGSETANGNHASQKEETANESHSERSEPANGTSASDGSETTGKGGTK